MLLSLVCVVGFAKLLSPAIEALGSGRTNVMQGAIHLVLFASFLFLTLVP